MSRYFVGIHCISYVALFGWGIWEHELAAIFFGLVAAVWSLGAWLDLDRTC